MLCIDCCVLIVARCVFRADGCLRALVSGSLRVVRWLSLAACCFGVCWLFVERCVGYCLLVVGVCCVGVCYLLCVVVCCVLFVGSCLLFVVCCLLFVVRWVDVYCVLRCIFGVLNVLFAACCCLVVVCYLLCVGLSTAVCCLLVITCRVPRCVLFVVGSC